MLANDLLPTALYCQTCGWYSEKRLLAPDGSNCVGGVASGITG
jgi:hypothetical protein